MTETLFERYKEALRAGHVAALRGRLEEAAVAYRAAIAIAADRPVPHTALAAILLRLGDPDGALASYEAALALAPGDDASLLGRAQALVVLRRTGEAAATYDDLAAVHERAGRRSEAEEAARRALAIEPGPERRRRLAALSGRRDADGRPAEPALPGPEVVPPEAAAVPPEAAAVPAEAAVVPAETEVGPDAEALAAQADLERAQALLADLERAEALLADLERAADRGDSSSAAAAALVAARAYRANGRLVAATDACLEGIGARPADIDLHLMLAEIAFERGWTAQAGETWRNLLRLVELEGDAARRETVRAAAATHLPGDPRFAPA